MLASTAAFSIFRSPRAFASTVSLSARLLRLAWSRSSSASPSLETGDALKVMATGLNDHGVGAASKRCTGCKSEHHQ